MEIINELYKTPIDNSIEEIQEKRIKISNEIINIFKNQGIVSDILSEQPGLVNIVKNGRRYGYEFGICKSDFIRHLMEGAFEYKHQDVLRVLEYICYKYGLKDAINYDRGYGVFAYRIWENEDKIEENIDERLEFDPEDEFIVDMLCETCVNYPCECNEYGEYEECGHCGENVHTDNCTCYDNEDEDEEGDE